MRERVSKRAEQSERKSDQEIGRAGENDGVRGRMETERWERGSVRRRFFDESAEKFAEKEKSAERRAPYRFPADRKISERNFLSLSRARQCREVCWCDEPRVRSFKGRKISNCCHDGADFPSLSVYFFFLLGLRVLFFHT